MRSEAKRLLAGAALTACVLATGTASAQPAGASAAANAGTPAAGAPNDVRTDQDEKRWGLGLDAQFVIPTGNLSNAVSVFVGPLVRIGYRVTPALELTGRTGFLFGAGDLAVKILPIWAGARYFVLDPSAGLYVGGELGMNLLMTPGIDFGIGSTPSSTDPRLGLNLGAGYQISRDLPIDIRAQAMFLNIGDSGGLSVGIGLSAGYTFQF